MRSPARIAFVAAVAGLACATPRVEPVATSPVSPGSHEAVIVDHLLIVVDSSGSISRRTLFPQQKATLEAFVGSLPEGNFSAAQVAFGGYERQVVERAPFERGRLERGASDLVFLDEATQLDRVFQEAQPELAALPGRAAIVVFSDGKPTNPGGFQPIPHETLDAARALASARSGATCFYAIQTSDDPAGESFLRDLAGVTSCGGYEPGDALGDVAAVENLQRGIFFGTAAALPAVAAAGASVSDSDGDGVVNAKDRCPGTPGGTRVSSDGCRVPSPIQFAFDSDALDAVAKRELDSLAEVLERNPELTLAIRGFTDADGDPAYNLELAKRRAGAAKSRLVASGVAASRVTTEAEGAGGFLGSNDTVEGRAANRRIEFELK